MKVVMVVNKELPAGLVANTTAVLGITLGNLNKDLIGPDCMDKEQVCHKGITQETIPVLGADTDVLKKIYHSSIKNEHVDLIDFNQTAQKCRDYSDYTQKLMNTRNSDLEFSGLCLSGPDKEINRLTGSLGLYR
ncbi:MAG: DUF2000 domain-containing protein [Proteobacteria bacterium]|nr:DUF2000 domain-containing protein [Pseudomonadota bacterium]MBU4131196.1 DUF2000 domain-containing protein [Pseudomonadota bacterium]